MALSLNVPDPQDIGDIEAGYSRIVFFALDMLSKKLRIVLAVYRTEAARTAGKNPVTTVEVVLGPDGVEEVTEEQEVDGEMVSVVVTEAIPGFDEIIASYQEVFDSTAAALYTVTKTHPQVKPLNPVDLL
jgi:hypothetical protein